MKKLQARFYKQKKLKATKYLEKNYFLCEKKIIEKENPHLQHNHLSLNTQKKIPKLRPILSRPWKLEFTMLPETEQLIAWFLHHQRGCFMFYVLYPEHVLFGWIQIPIYIKSSQLNGQHGGLLPNRFQVQILARERI